MIAPGRQLDIWDDPDFSFPGKERDFVQLRAACTPGRQPVLLRSCAESGDGPSSCLFLSGESRHRVSRGLGEKAQQPVIYFRPSLCRCILNQIVGRLLLSFLCSERVMLPALHRTVVWGYNKITIPVLEEHGLTGNTNVWSDPFKGSECCHCDKN